MRRPAASSWTLPRRSTRGIARGNSPNGVRTVRWGPQGLWVVLGFVECAWFTKCDGVHTARAVRMVRMVRKVRGMRMGAFITLRHAPHGVHPWFRGMRDRGARRTRINAGSLPLRVRQHRPSMPPWSAVCPREAARSTRGGRPTRTASGVWPGSQAIDSLGLFREAECLYCGRVIQWRWGRYAGGGEGELHGGGEYIGSGETRR